MDHGAHNNVLEFKKCNVLFWCLVISTFIVKVYNKLNNFMNMY